MRSVLSFTKVSHLVEHNGSGDDVVLIKLNKSVEHVGNSSHTCLSAQTSERRKRKSTCALFICFWTSSPLVWRLASLWDLLLLSWLPETWRQFYKCFHLPISWHKIIKITTVMHKLFRWHRGVVFQRWKLWLLTLFSVSLIYNCLSLYSQSTFETLLPIAQLQVVLNKTKQKENAPANWRSASFEI